MNAWMGTYDRPLIIGHRGASAHAPENTLAAFQLARAQGADGIEFDVMRCGSGEVVVIHDDTVDRTTNGTGRVSAMALAELQTLDAGQGQRIPTLDAVIHETAGGPRPFLLNIELKDYLADEFERQVIEIVRRCGGADRVLFSSFDPRAVQRLAELAPDIPCGLLYVGGMPVDPCWPHRFCHPEHRLVTPEYVSGLRAEGRWVNTWTVNDPADIVRVARCGVQGIIGDSPATMVAVIRGEAARPK